ncbi:MAG: GGDEF domain-containing phosphodiesterase [Acidimicrobiales bacterium]
MDNIEVINTVPLVDLISDTIRLSRLDGSRAAVIACTGRINGEDADEETNLVLGERLERILRDGDHLRPYRNGWVVIGADIVDAKALTPVIERVVEALEQPIRTFGEPQNVRAAIGVALGDRAADGESLLLGADLALEAARVRGGGVEALEPNLGEAISARLRDEADLDHSIGDERFVLFHQPVVPLGSNWNNPRGVEVYARWLHPQDGLVGPGRFIPVAEITGQMQNLGRELIRLACHDLAQISHDHAFLSMNLSAQQLTDQMLTADILEEVENFAVPPEALAFEITEEVLAVPESVVLENLRRFKSAGFKVFLDDFGVGEASLQTLLSFPLDAVKIDGSFVHPDVDERFVDLVVTINDRLGVPTIAEGVETPEQLEVLVELGVDYAQGFEIGAPQPMLSSLVAPKDAA